MKSACTLPPLLGAAGTGRHGSEGPCSPPYFIYPPPSPPCTRPKSLRGCLAIHICTRCMLIFFFLGTRRGRPPSSTAMWRTRRCCPRPGRPSSCASCCRRRVLGGQLMARPGPGGGWLGCLPSSPPLYAGNVPGMEACGGAGEQGPQASGLHHLVGAGPLQRDLSCRFLLLHPLCVGGCWVRACLSPQWTTSEPLATQWPKGQQAGAAGGARQCA